MSRTLNAVRGSGIAAVPGRAWKVGGPVDDGAVSLGVDEHASRRAELLTPVKSLCARAGIATEAGVLPPRSLGWRTGPVLGLRHVAANGAWDASVTVVRARRLSPAGQRADGKYSRDPRSGYDLNSPGELVYEVQVHEEDDGGRGHGPRPLVVFELAGTPQAAVDVLTLWAARGSLFGCEVPLAKPEAAVRQERRRYDHRQAAATVADVNAAAVPPEAGDLAAAVDPAALCWFFPREREGRFRRSAVVALAPCRDGRPHLSGPWLTARADGGRLVLEVRDLIPANQAHRWDVTPWLWDRRHAGAPPPDRWQAGDVRDVRPRSRCCATAGSGLRSMRAESSPTRVSAGYWAGSPPGCSGRS